MRPCLNQSMKTQNGVFALSPATTGAGTADSTESWTPLFASRSKRVRARHSRYPLENGLRIMKTRRLGRSNLQSSQLSYGCWRIAGTWNPAEVTPKSEAAGRQAVIAAYEAGYALFDHADIYADGVAEQIFGQVLKQVTGMRER